MKLQPVNFIVTGIILLFCQNTFAQSTATISPQRLPLIEQEMFNDSNEYFIIIDLMIDGLVKPGQRFDFRYGNETSTFNGKELEKSLQEKYAARMKAFYVHEGASATTTFGMTSDSVSMKEILDPSSKFRTWAKASRLANRQLYHKNTEARNILGQMVNEQLLDTSGWYNVEFNQTGVYVNKHKLEGAVGEKYVQLFSTALNIKPDSKEYSLLFRGSPPCTTTK